MPRPASIRVGRSRRSVTSPRSGGSRAAAIGCSGSRWCSAATCRDRRSSIRYPPTSGSSAGTTRSGRASRSQASRRPRRSTGATCLANSTTAASLERVVQQFAGIDEVRRYVAFLHGVAGGRGRGTGRHRHLSTVRRCDAASVPAPRRAERPAQRSPGRSARRELRPDGGHRRARVAIAGQRPASRLRAALQPPRAGAGDMNGRAGLRTAVGLSGTSQGQHH